jgi:formate-dependent nitrite reductase cytochrome c552 subunit
MPMEVLTPSMEAKDELHFRSCDLVEKLLAAGRPTPEDAADIVEEAMRQIAEHFAKREREQCCSLVFGNCHSDNVAQRTVNAIRRRPII